MHKSFHIESRTATSGDAIDISAVEKAAARRLDRAKKKVLMTHVDEDFYDEVKILSARTRIKMGLLLHFFIARGLEDFSEVPRSEVYDKLRAESATKARQDHQKTS